MNRTLKQIEEQIQGLQDLKKNLPEYNMFGDPNHAKFNAQIAILKGEAELGDYEEGNWEEMDYDNQIYRAAEEAEDWLYNDGESLIEE